ncbi:MAG: hypothetical protein AAFW89_00480 [Bacteroidota bacterium]
MTRIFFFLVLTIALYASSCDNEQGSDVPDIVTELREVSQYSQVTFSLTFEEIGRDSLWIRMYLESEKSSTDTLYHSTNYPILIPYIGSDEISHPFRDLVIIGALKTTILPPKPVTLIKEFKAKREIDAKYAMVGVISFRNSLADIGNNLEADKDLWLVSNSVSIPQK